MNVSKRAKMVNEPKTTDAAAQNVSAGEDHASPKEPAAAPQETQEAKPKSPSTKDKKPESSPRKKQRAKMLSRRTVSIKFEVLPLPVFFTETLKPVLENHLPSAPRTRSSGLAVSFLPILEPALSLILYFLQPEPDSPSMRPFAVKALGLDDSGKLCPADFQWNLPVWPSMVGQESRSWADPLLTIPFSDKGV